MWFVRVLGVLVLSVFLNSAYAYSDYKKGDEIEFVQDDGSFVTGILEGIDGNTAMVSFESELTAVSIKDLPKERVKNAIAQLNQVTRILHAPLTQVKCEASAVGSPSGVRRVSLTGVTRLGPDQ